MNPLLRAGIELTLDKVATEVEGASLSHFLKKATEVQGTTQVRKSEGHPPSSNSSEGMEDKTRHTNGTGPEEEELAAADYDTGKVHTAVGKQNITTETETQDLSLPKTASSEDFLEAYRARLENKEANEQKLKPAVPAKKSGIVSDFTQAAKHKLDAPDMEKKRKELIEGKGQTYTPSYKSKAKHMMHSGGKKY